MSKDKKRIIVEHGKHGDSYYAADTTEEVKAAALKMVSLRLDYFISSWGKFEESWSYKNYNWASIPKSEEEISKLPTDEARVEARKILKSYLYSKESHEENEKQYLRAKKAVEENNGDAAYQIIIDRGDHEYEEWSYEYLD